MVLGMQGQTTQLGDCFDLVNVDGLLEHGGRIAKRLSVEQLIPVTP